MRCTQVFGLALIFLCLVSATLGRQDQCSSLFRRGSPPRSPPRHESSGLLGDVVRQGTKRPASSMHPAQSSQAHGAHPSQSAHVIVHPTQVVQPHSAGRGHSAHPVQLTQTHSAHTMQSMQGHSAHSLTGPRPHTSSAVLPVTSDGRKLDHIGSTAKPPGKSKGTGNPVGRPRNPPKPPKEPKPPKVAKPKEPHVPWWQRAGGKPNAARGTGPQYEVGLRHREKKKLKEQGRQVDEHPANKHPPHGGGGGPGSPGSGSHAVSKRRHWLE